MASGVRTGSKYKYAGDAGLGAKSIEGDLHPDMADLDLSPGTLVKVVGQDDERDLVLVEWEDAQGNPRITSVPLDTFGTDFVKGAS